MREKIIVATFLAFATGAMFPMAASADEHRPVVAVPVSLDFGDYNPTHEALQNAINDRLMRSTLVTPNADAYRALTVAVRLALVKGKGRIAAVTYSWDRTTIRQMTYPCSRAQISRCSTLIVSGAERASRTVRRSSSWLR